MNYKINIQTVTELCQSKGKTTLGFTPTLQIMTKSKIVNNSHIGYFPYYTGNSIRGLLHRELANYVMDALKEKSTLTISPRNYHLIAAGGGSNFQDQTFSVVDKVRELNPIASAFGISLAVEGKLMVSNFNPLDCFFKEDEENSDILHSQLIGKIPFAKVDDILNHTTKYANLVDKSSKELYIAQNIDTQEQRANERETAKKTTSKKTTIRSYNNIEFIIEGANLVGYIGTKKEFNDLEDGMLLKGFELMAKCQLGGMRNRGFGVVEYTITTDDDAKRVILKSKKNEANIYNPIVETFYNEEDTRKLKIFEDWVENISAENLELDKILS